ncbi:Zinc finger protein 845 like protein [Argiope bruennichi]|uniref:Zinc finger protein 845 like protein n=1 Tax=Argiope bruennichi TaxID=94029 RepID=A0A8T0FBY4_ARGBR|nr:Zinc finger protein 845 like protein [Argiope bruennichi]
MLPYKCEICNLRFSVKWRLVHHQKIHESENATAKSDESDSSSAPNPKKVVLKNAEVLQDFNTHECPVCHISFAGKKQLERHERVHGDKKYYQCDRCYLGFFWKSNYNRHRKHSCTRRVFQCEICHRTFNKKLHFLRHRSLHGKDRKLSEDPVGNQDAGPSTPARVDRARDGLLKSKDKETDTEVIDITPETSPIKGKPRASKLIPKSSEKDATESKSDDKSGEELLSSDPNFEPKKKKPRNKYERKHKCDLCGLGFRFKCDLGRHRRTHDSVKPFPCDQCDLGFNWKSNLVRHQRRMHCGKKAFHCDSCGEGFTKRYHLTRHRTNNCGKSGNGRKASTSGKRQSESDDCNCDNGSDSNPVVIQLLPKKDGATTSTVKKKRASLNKDREFEVGKQTTKSTEVNIIYLHACYDEIKPVSQEECKSGRDRVQSDAVNTEEVYDCRINNGSRRRGDHDEDSRSEAPARKRLRKEVKEFVCSVCSRVFTRKSCHLQHERSHYRQPLRCEWCHRTFARKSVFLKHQRIHTGEKPFQCETCLCYFRQKSQLVQHKKIHSGLKPHECEVCKRRFNRKSVLDRHKMIHTGEKPFECEVCHLCFNQKSILVQHLRIHTGLKPYKCKKCNYSFTQKWNYRRHKHKVHTSGKTLPIKCNTCDSNFPRKRILIQNEKIHERRKFVFHIYNTRFAGKRFGGKDKLKEASGHSGSHGETHSPRNLDHSDKNPDSDYCEIIEEIQNGKTTQKIQAEQVIKDVKDITDFPDHCIPINIYIRKGIRKRGSLAKDNKSYQVEIQSTKEKPIENGGRNLEFNKKTESVEIEEDTREMVQMETSFRTEKKSSVEDQKRNQENKDVRLMEEDINISKIKEMSLMKEIEDKTSEINMNPSVQEDQDV